MLSATANVDAVVSSLANAVCLSSAHVIYLSKLAVSCAPLSRLSGLAKKRMSRGLVGEEGG